MNIFKRVWVRYQLRHYAIPYELWTEVCKSIAVLQTLSSGEKAHLRILTTLFLREKRFVGVQGLQLTNRLCVAIASQACLPVLKLGLDYLSGWIEIVVYPDAFRVCRDERDNASVVHHQHQKTLVCESWSRGPIILSWSDVENDCLGTQPGRNVVIHEISHKLDQLNGPADGFPPLPYRMPIPEWTAALSTAYHTLIKSIEHHHRACIDPYAATSPAEFFAVASEYFFCRPEILNQHYPDVYQRLTLYYRQDPLHRIGKKTNSYST